MYLVCLDISNSQIFLLHYQLFRELVHGGTGLYQLLKTRIHATSKLSYLLMLLFIQHEVPV